MLLGGGGALLLSDDEEPVVVESSVTEVDPKASLGFLTIRSKPIARVYVDGQPTGKLTPIVKLSIEAGIAGH